MLRRPAAAAPAAWQHCQCGLDQQLCCADDQQTVGQLPAMSFLRRAAEQAKLAAESTVAVIGEAAESTATVIGESVDSTVTAVSQVAETTAEVGAQVGGVLGGAANAVADSTPVIGHVKGGIHYLSGDKEAGDHAMKSASRSTAVIGGGVAGTLVAGPAGGVAGAMAGGSAADAATTGIEYQLTGEYKPQGVVKAAEGIKEGNVVRGTGELGVTLVMDGLSGGAIAGAGSGLQSAIAKKATTASLEQKFIEKSVEGAAKAVGADEAVKSALVGASTTVLTTVGVVTTYQCAACGHAFEVVLAGSGGGDTTDGDDDSSSQPAPEQAGPQEQSGGSCCPKCGAPAARTVTAGAGAGAEPEPEPEPDSLPEAITPDSLRGGEE
jgi:hypothetical protein